MLGSMDGGGKEFARGLVHQALEFKLQQYAREFSRFDGKFAHKGIDVDRVGLEYFKDR